MSFSLIKIYHVFLAADQFVAQYCDGDRINHVISGGETFYVRFQSDGSREASGFRLFYKYTDGESIFEWMKPSRHVHVSRGAFR